MCRVVNGFQLRFIQTDSPVERETLRTTKSPFEGNVTPPGWFFYQHVNLSVDSFQLNIPAKCSVSTYLWFTYNIVSQSVGRGIIFNGSSDGGGEENPSFFVLSSFSGCCQRVKSPCWRVVTC